MAKRHYASSKSAGRINHEKDHFNDEMHSDKDKNSGMYARPVVNGGFYGDRYEKERLEMQDASMIKEDPRAIANLPQEVMIKAYPRTGPYLPEALDDTIRGVDGQMDYDDSKRRAHFYPKKV